MTKITSLLLSFLFIFIISQSGFAQKKPGESPAKTSKRIETYLAKIEKAGFSGTVLVELNGKKVISKGYGLSDIEQKRPNTPETIFDIGSITKQFTGAAIIKLEMQGKLSTEDKLSKYFDQVPPDKAEITIHHLLRHSAGLPGVVGGDYEPISQSEFIERVLKSPLKFASGTEFSYSNVGYSLLGIIIEKVSGQTYEQFLYENLWKPAHMEMTGYQRPSFDPHFIAVGYKDEVRWGKPNEKAWDTNAPFWHLKGNGGILSTTEDLYKWDQALLSDTVLSKAAKAKYYHPKLRVNESPNPYYAYGWDVLKTERNTFLARHNGTNGVFYSDFHRYLDEGITIIMLSNKSHPNFLETNLAVSKIIADPAYQPLIPIAENQANRAFTEEVIRLTLEKGLPAGIAANRNRKQSLDLIERLVNIKGYAFLADKKLPEAIILFRLNTAAFPKSANTFDSLGEAYLEAGDTASAIENYKKSYLLDPDNKNAAAVLQRLTGK